MRAFLAGRALVLAIVLSSPGCAASSTTATALHPAAARPERYDRTVITQAEMQEHSFSTVFDAVEGLRRTWLNRRGPDSFLTPSRIWVYYEDMRIGGIETLRDFTVADVTSVRYYNGIEATARWGIDHGAGVIYLTALPHGR